MSDKQGVNTNFIDFLKNNAEVEFKNEEKIKEETVTKAVYKTQKNMSKKISPSKLEKVLKTHIADEKVQPDFDIEEKLVRDNFNVINSIRFAFLNNLARQMKKKKRTWHFKVKKVLKYRLSWWKMVKFLNSRFLLPELALSTAVLLLFFVYVASFNSLAAGKIIEQMNKKIFGLQPRERVIQEVTARSDETNLKPTKEMMAAFIVRNQGRLGDNNSSEIEVDAKEFQGRVAGVMESGLPRPPAPPNPPTQPKNRLQTALDKIAQKQVDISNLLNQKLLELLGQSD